MVKSKYKNRNRIGRTFEYTICTGQYVDSENNIIDFNETVDGKINDMQRATRMFQRRFGTKRVIVYELHHKQTFESAPLAEFRKIIDCVTVTKED